MYDFINTNPQVKHISGHIEPTDIKVFYEEGKPYIHYKGVLNYMGDQYAIDIPKMDMVLKTLEHVTEYSCTFDYKREKVIKVPVLSECHAEHEVYFTADLIKKKMSKSEIEKELGYKVDIVD